jgi:paraquat-inducible protein B
MKEKIVVSRKFNGAPVTVTVQDRTVEMSMTINDFLAALAKEAKEALAQDAARNAGNPAMLMTNAQLAARLVSSMVEADVLNTLTMAAEAVIKEIKKASVVAE